MIQWKKSALATGIILSLCSVAVKAQKGNNGLQAGIEAGLPTGDFSDFKSAPGVYGKFLYGLGRPGQATLSVSYSAHKSRGASQAYGERTRIRPLMAGYRFNKQGLYFEPQVGVGMYRLTTKIRSGSTTIETTDTGQSFTWALGGGLKVNRIDLGARYQQGYPSGSGVALFVLHAGYAINF